MPLYPGGGTQTPSSTPVGATTPVVLSGDIPYVLTPDGYKKPDFRINYRGANNAALGAGAAMTVVPSVANKRYIMGGFVVGSSVAGEYTWRQIDDADSIAFKLLASGFISISFLPHCMFPNADNMGYEVVNNTAGAVSITAFIYGWLYDTTNGDFEEM